MNNTAVAQVEQKEVMNKKRKGFTLVELGAVMAILAVLMMLIVPRFAKSTENAQIKVFEANYRTMISAIQLYQAQTPDASFPTTLDEISAAGLLQPASEINGKPVSGAKYEIVKDAGGKGVKLQCTATFPAAGTYTLTYDFATGTTDKSGGPGSSSSI